MRMRSPHPKAESSLLPSGVYIQPRRPEGLDFAAVPRDWFAWSKTLSTILNLFSFIIPEHERFFIRTVRKYKAQGESAEDQALLRAFMQQEAIHYQLHEEFNETRRAYGMHVDRDLDTIRQVFAGIERRYSQRVRLGMTAFMEHVTAVSAHIALGKNSPLPYMHPSMRALWEWHALEEIEHKAVAFDLFKRAGGGYLLRVYSALLAVLIDARLFRVLGRRARADHETARAAGEPRGALSDEQLAIRRDVYRLERRNVRRAFWAALRYFLPGFHPWQLDDSDFARRVSVKYDGAPALPEL